MPKFLLRGTYTSEGLKGVMKDGGSKRVEATKQIIESLGGKLESFYFAFGEDDFIIICEGPDNIGAIAGSFIVNASGAVKLKTTVLISPEEVNEATKRTTTYRPPGQ